MKKWISLLLVMMLTLTFTACGSKDNGGGEEDGQNPVMNFVGDYQCDRAVINITPLESDGVIAVVTWGNSAEENSSWTMSGTFDESTLSFTYTDGVRTDYTYNADGEIETSTDVYTDGTGSITITDGEQLSLTWKDDKENIADGMVFEYIGSLP